MELKQQAMAFKKLTQSFPSKEQQYTVHACKEKLKKCFFHWPEKMEDKILWMVKRCKRSDIVQSDQV